MILSKTFISILNSHGFCVDKTSEDRKYIGTTYEISRAILGEVAFNVCVETGDNMFDFINYLYDKKSDYESPDACEHLTEIAVEYGVISINELINLAEMWNDIKPSDNEYKNCIRITLNNDQTLYVFQNKKDETDIRLIQYMGTGKDVDFSDKVFEKKIDYPDFLKFIFNNTEV